MPNVHNGGTRFSVGTPVPDAIRCLVLRMHSRLHIEIMTRRRSRWSTCRPLLAHRAESAHQRLLDRLPISIERIPGIAHHLARVGDVPELLGQPEQADLVFDHRWVCTHHGVPFWSSSLRLSWSTTRVTPLLFPEEVSDHIATSTTQWFRGSVVAAARRGHSSCSSACEVRRPCRREEALAKWWGVLFSLPFPRQVRILSIGIVRASDDSCNNTA